MCVYGVRACVRVCLWCVCVCHNFVEEKFVPNCTVCNFDVLAT